jgi:hypothetical protein
VLSKNELGNFVVDGKTVADPPCTTLEAILRRLSISGEHLSLPLRSPAAIGAREVTSKKKNKKEKRWK